MWSRFLMDYATVDEISLKFEGGVLAASISSNDLNVQSSLELNLCFKLFELCESIAL